MKAKNSSLRVGLPRLECSSQFFPYSLGGGQESCHPKQALKCQNNQSQVTALSCDNVSIWEIWIWQSFSIWQVRLAWYLFIFLERACVPSATDKWHILCFPALQDGIPMLLWVYEDFNANPDSVLKWAVLHRLAMRHMIFEHNLFWTWK